MPALNFKKQFMAAVLTGTKSQTIRAPRKQPIKAGDKLHLFTGMRTKGCMRLRVTTCTRVGSVEIHANGQIALGNSYLSTRQMEAFAKADGFGSTEEMVAWFREVHGLPFKGQLIEWRA